MLHPDSDSVSAEYFVSLQGEGWSIYLMIQNTVHTQKPLPDFAPEAVLPITCYFLIFTLYALLYAPYTFFPAESFL